MPRLHGWSDCSPEEVLAFRAAALDSVLEALGDGVVVVDSDGTLLYLNEAARQLLVLEPPGLPPKCWPAECGIYLPDGSGLFPSERLPIVQALQGEFAGPAEALIKGRPPSGDRYVSMAAIPLREEAGVQRGALMLMHDVTTVHRISEELRRQRDWFSTILDTVGSLVVLVDRQGRIVSFNRACELVTGCKFEEVMGRPIWELLPPEEAPEMRQALELLWEGGPASQREGYWLTRSGHKRLIVWSNTVLRDPQGRPEYVVCTGIDITDRKRLEEQLRQAQKMEALGRLAGGIAHDFNNLVTIISGYAQMLHDEQPAGSPAREPLAEILDAAGRAASLASRLLMFSRQQPTQPRLVDINHIVAGMEKMLRRVIGEDIELITVLAANLAPVKADPVQLEQVIMNLVLNARDAMPHGGRIVIETAAVNLDEEYLKRHLGARMGPHILLAVSDTGTGMDADTMRQAFDPFFTTKEKGTGLGLSTVYGIVQQHGGQVWVYSEPGLGSTFKIYLPVATESQEQSQGLAHPQAAAAGEEVILVAEDEPHLRKLVSDILRREGYSVLVAASPEEALRICQEYPGVIHLLLTDVVMPRMGGRDLAGRVRAARPSVRVLFMSGYADRGVVYNGALEPGVAFLQKPFTKVGLLGKIREVLQEA